MNCGKVRRILLKQVNMDNPGQISQEITAHLNACASCKKFFETVRQVDSVVKLKREELPPEEYWRSYWSRLRARTRKTVVPQEEKPFVRSLFPRLRLALEISAILLIVISVFLVAESRKETRTISSSMQALQKERATANRPFSEKSVAKPPENKMKSEQPTFYAKNFRNDIKLFNEVSSLFPSNIGWVATDNGQVELGLLDAGSLPNDDGVSGRTKKPLLFLNFTVILNNPSVGTQKISSPRIITLEGNEVRVKTDDLLHSGRRLEYNFLPLLVARKTVRTTLQLSIVESESLRKQGVEAELRTAITLHDGETVKVGKISSSEGDYSVFLNLHINENRKTETNKGSMI